ncbi:MAG: serine hydrolase, partial [Gammaproteobacteria bacterium]|nr:serine hydrolase [Gammaproteobacteria bacterium]
NGERVLPKGYADFVSTVAPAWAADGRPIYGAFFWLSGADYGLDPGDVFGMRGAGGQVVDIVPSKGLSSHGWDTMRVHRCGARCAEKE